MQRPEGGCWWTRGAATCARGSARSRGLGTVWTTFHLMHEEEVARILGIPYDEVTQVALIPVAYTIGTEFKPGRRNPLDTMVHWDHW